MVNQNSENFKSNSKEKAIASLVLGSIGVISLIMGYGIAYRFPGMMLPFSLQVILLIFLLIIPLISGILGFCLGIVGLSSTKKISAMIGIIISILALLLPLWMILNKIL